MNFFNVRDLVYIKQGKVEGVAVVVEHAGVSVRLEMVQSKLQVITHKDNLAPLGYKVVKKKEA